MAEYWKRESNQWVAIVGASSVDIDGSSLPIDRWFIRLGRSTMAAKGYYEEFLTPGLAPYSDPAWPPTSVDGEPRAYRIAQGVPESLATQIANAAVSVRAAIYQHAAAHLALSLPARDAREIAREPAKEAEAIEYQAHSTVGPEMASELPAGYSLVQADALAQSIIDHANTDRAFRGAVALTRRTHLDSLAALVAASGTTVAQVQAYDYSQGWPAVPADPFS